MEPERDSFDAFDEVVDGFGRPVGDVGVVPGDDLVSPTFDGASEAADLERHLGVGEVSADVVDPGSGDVGVGVVVDLTDDFLSDNRPSGRVVSGVR